MSDWRDEIERALNDFIAVAKLAGQPLLPDEIEIEYLPAPHRAPTLLPPGRMAVYCFWGDNSWLKVGKAGPNSQARYTSQHYNPGSAPSTLAASLLRDSRMKTASAFVEGSAGDWIKSSCCRVNILIPTRKPRELLSLLEAFLHVRLLPRYEGCRSPQMELGKFACRSAVNGKATNLQTVCKRVTPNCEPHCKNH